MKPTLEVELQPFQTPNYVLAVTKPGKREDGMRVAPSYPLSDLDPETLEKMCDDFRSEVFRKAGKDRPPCGRAETKPKVARSTQPAEQERRG